MNTYYKSFIREVRPGVSEDVFLQRYVCKTFHYGTVLLEMLEASYFFGPTDTIQTYEGMRVCLSLPGLTPDPLVVSFLFC